MDAERRASPQESASSTTCSSWLRGTARLIWTWTRAAISMWTNIRSEEHTSELQSQSNLVCRLLLEKKSAPRRARDLRAVDRADVPASPASRDPRDGRGTRRPGALGGDQVARPFLAASRSLHRVTGFGRATERGRRRRQLPVRKELRTRVSLLFLRGLRFEKH